MNLIIIYVNRFNFQYLKFYGYLPSAIPNYAVSSSLDFKNC